MISWMTRLGVGICLAFAFARVHAQPVSDSSSERTWAGFLSTHRLSQQLHSQDISVREQAALALAEVGHPSRARELLMEALLRESVPQVQIAILSSLTIRAHPDLLEGLTHFFYHQDADLAEPAALAIAAIGTSKALRTLVEALTPQNEHTARAATVALSRVGLEAAPAVLQWLREEPDSIAAIRLLGELRDVEAVPILVSLSGSDQHAVRIASIQALGQIGDDRGRVAVLRALDDSIPNVAQAAWHSLPNVGLPQDASRVETQLLQSDGSYRRFYLETLLELSPARATAIVRSWVGSEDPHLLRIASELVIARPVPDFIPILYGLFQEGSRREQAASALAEVEGGQGFSVLLREISHPEAQRELAVLVRRWRHLLSNTQKQQAYARLREIYARQSPSRRLRTLVLRALAGDDSILEDVERMLRDTDAEVRDAAAHAAWLIGDPRLEGIVSRLIREERDVNVLRRLFLAAQAVGANPEKHFLRYALHQPELAPEAALLVGRLARTSRHTRLWEQELRRLLRSPQPRARSCAAWALGRLGAPSAWRALFHRVRTDPALEVRRAAARALARLRSSRGGAYLLSYRFVEDDEDIIRWLDDAAHRRRTPFTEGNQVLRFRLSTQNTGIPLDLVLSDGRWLRMRTLSSGDLILADLTESSVDVRLTIDEQAI